MKTKVCRICDEEKVSTEFHLHKSSKDGFRNDCKECRKTRDKRWMSTDAVRARYNEKYGIKFKNMTYMFKQGDEVVYIGSTDQGGFRIWEHYNKNTNHSFANHEPSLIRQLKYKFHVVWHGDNLEDAQHQEKALIQIHQPKYNKIKYKNYAT